jgi:protein-tyrosine kinase
MPRIRDALRQADLNRERLAVTVPPPRAFQPEEPPRIPAERVEEVPFIEVGGGQGSVDASPSVLAAIKNGAPKARQVQKEAAPPVRPEASAVPGIGSLTFQLLPREAVVPPPPEERFSPDLVALHRPGHVLAEQYRSLAAALAAQLPAGQPHVLLFAAATTATDTTTVLLNLGITCARQGKSVVIVDANMQRPAVAEQLGMSLAPGLRDVLTGGFSLHRAIRETGLENMHALTAGRPQESERNLLAGQAMRSVLRHLRGRYEWVLIASACWDGRPDVVALGSACDAVYLVLPAPDAGKPAIEDLLQLIPQQGSQLRGCIYTGR